MKTVALFAAHFPPSNLAGVHRARLWAQHLHEFGWRPIIVTTNWNFYEEKLDWNLCDLISKDLNIIRTPAVSAKPLRLVGDIGIRGMPWHLATLKKLFRNNVIDFLHITVPSFYSAMLGELIYRQKPIPFGIDYIDPWVCPPPDGQRVSIKANVAARLANVLEPYSVRHASLITGISSGYFSGVLERNPHLKKQAVIAAMPYGNSALDFDMALRNERTPYLFDPKDGAFHLVYAGAMLPKGYEVLESFFAGLSLLKSTRPTLFRTIRIHFVGTGKSPDDPQAYNILPIAQRWKLDDVVTEHPARISYADVLVHLAAASAILIVGSTEAHYSPSKIYQSIQAKRPVFALLHEASTAVEVIISSKAGWAVVLNDQRLPSSQEIAQSLESFVLNRRYDHSHVDWSKFEAYSARESARKLADALDAASARFAGRVR